MNADTHIEVQRYLILHGKTLCDELKQFVINREPKDDYKKKFIWELAHDMSEGLDMSTFEILSVLDEDMLVRTVGIDWC